MPTMHSLNITSRYIFITSLIPSPSQHAVFVYA